MYHDPLQAGPVSSDSDGFVAPLQTCMPGQSASARLTFDATLAKPLRIRDGQGVKLSAEVHRNAAELIAAIDEHLVPLQIRYVLADLQQPASAPCMLDAGRLGVLPRLLFARAAAQEALQRVELELFPRLRVVPGSGSSRSIDTTIDVCSADPAMSDSATQAAIRDFGAWAGKTWARAVASVAGPWALASGVRELRLAGSMRPDLRQQLSVLAGDCHAGVRPH